MEAGAVEVQLATINLKLDLLIEHRTDHEARLRILEQFKWKLMGAAVSSGALAGYVMDVVR